MILASAAVSIPLLAACGAPPPPSPPSVAGPVSGLSTATSAPPPTTAPITPPAYDIVVRPVGTVAPDVLAAFQQAEHRWEQIITADVADVGASGFNGCLGAGPTGTIDDLVIDVEIAPEDGPGGILGSAGPCSISSGDGLPRAGLMRFDADDVAAMQASGRLLPVVLHEMGHVLGIGTLWKSPLIIGKGTSDPRFTGLGAVLAWHDVGGTGSVPVEDAGGPGTRDSHWRESTFGNELMTGWIGSSTNPLSAVTISSLADLGYGVDPTRADDYMPPSWIMAPAMRSTEEDIRAREELVTPDGTL